MLADRLTGLLTGLRNSIITTVSDVVNALRTQGVEVSQLGNSDIAGDWAWDVITKALELSVINLSDADYDAMYHVFRRCATLEEMVREALERPDEVDENFINELTEEFRENVEALNRVRGRLSILINR